MLIVTTNDLPGWQIRRVCGEVFGLTVRSRNAFAQMGAGFKAMFGGELQGMTKNLADSRNEAMGRLIAEARGPRRQRHRRDAVRHHRDRRRVDRDLRLRNCGRGGAGDGRREIHGKPARVRRVAPTAVIVCSPVRSV